MILALDPGPKETAWVLYDPAQHALESFDYEANEAIAERFAGYRDTHDVAVEMIASYGMPVGKETFETCVWIGRFLEAFGGGEYVYRRDVKLHLCNSSRAKDANVRQAVLDRFERTGGGKNPQVGTKGQPGPLYGVSGDVWSALAVALTFAVYLEDKPF